MKKKKGWSEKKGKKISRTEKIKLKSKILTDSDRRPLVDSPDVGAQDGNINGPPSVVCDPLVGPQGQRRDREGGGEEEPDGQQSKDELFFLFFFLVFFGRSEESEEVERRRKKTTPPPTTSCQSKKETMMMALQLFLCSIFPRFPLFYPSLHRGIDMNRHV